MFRAPTNIVFIPPETFRISSPTNEVDRCSDQGPQTDVIISRGFWIGKYEVTQGEYRAAMGHNPATGEQIQIPAKRVVKFRVAKAAKDAILGGK